MSLYEIVAEPKLDAPALVGALQGWVDAAGVSTTSASYLADEGQVVVRFDAEALFDYKVHRPLLDIVDGKMRDLTWPELTIRHVRAGSRDLLILVGPEPDHMWRRFTDEIADVAGRFGVVEWVSLGSIGAAVPHTRPTPMLATASRSDLVEAADRLPQGLLRVPAAVVTLLEYAFSSRGILSVGFWTQVPHYVSGPYVPGVVVQLERLARHLGVEFDLDALRTQADEQRLQLDALVAERPQARAYLENLEQVYDAQAVPSGEDIAAEIERFLSESAGGDSPFGTSG